MGGRGASSSIKQQTELKEKTYVEKRKQFNDYRFNGLNAERTSNKYITMNRVSEDGNKVVVNVSNEHLFSTPYGYGLRLDKDNVLWLKSWQVSRNYYGNEVMIDKKYFSPKSAKEDSRFESNKKALTFENWKNIAKTQQKANNKVQWQQERPFWLKGKDI